MKSRWKLLFPIVLIHFAAGFASAQQNPGLNYLPGGADLAGRAPELFASLTGNRFVAVDPADASVVIFSDAGEILAKSQPLSFFPASVRTYRDRLEFVDANNVRSAVLPRLVNPAQIGSLTESENAQAPARPAYRLTRQNSQSVTLAFGGKTPRRLVVRSRLGGHLTTVKFMGNDARGRYFVQAAEVTQVSPKLTVRVTVLRFSAAGQLDGVSPVELQGADSIPSNLLALNDSGVVTAMIPTASGVSLQTLSFNDPSKKKQSAAPAPSVTRDLAVTVTRQDAPPDRGPTTDAPPVIRPTNRADILKRANAYLGLKWTVTARNLGRDGVENKCAKQEGKFWERPRRLNDELVGKTIGYTPYHWGGNDTPESFQAKMAQGALAGSVCTCREEQFNYCQVPYAAGVDCSGFVTRAWGTSKYGTSNLGQIATPITSLSSVRPGDAFNKAGNHVRLVASVIPGPELRFQLIESATNLRCEGVCSKVYSVEELADYTPMRFKGVTD